MFHHCAPALLGSVSAIPTLSILLSQFAGRDLFCRAFTLTQIILCVISTVLPPLCNRCTIAARYNATAHMIPLERPVKRKAALAFQRRAYVVQLEAPDLITFRYLRSRREFTLPLSEVFRIAQVRTVAAEKAAAKKEKKVQRVR